MQKIPFVTGSIARASAFCLLLTVTAACGPVFQQPDDNPAVGSGHTDLTGQVLLGDLGPASGAVVTLDGPDELVVVADESGQFRFRNVAAGAYQLQAAAGPDTLEQVIMHPLTVPAQGSVSVETLVFTPTGDISGNVNVNGRDSDGDVLVYIPGTSWLALSNDDGSFTISRVPVGTYRVVAKGTSTTAATAPTVVVEYQQETIIPDFTVTAIDPTTAGQSCWDLNGNGNPDLPGEDLNGDGLVDVDDCHGQDGQNGTSGQHCWDLNGNGVGDLPDEDQNDDGAVDAADCAGSSIQLPTRIDGNVVLANSFDAMLLQSVTEITGKLILESAFSAPVSVPSLRKLGGIEIRPTATGVVHLESDQTWTVAGDVETVTLATNGIAAEITDFWLPVSEISGDLKIQGAPSLASLSLPIERVGQSISLRFNDALTRVNFNALTFAGGISLDTNQQLSTFASPLTWTELLFLSRLPNLGVDLPDLEYARFVTLSQNSSSTGFSLPVTRVERLVVTTDDVTSVTFPQLQSAETLSFWMTSGLQSIDMPSLSSIDESFFIVSTGVETLNLPILSGTINDFAVYQNSNLCQSIVDAIRNNLTITGSNVSFGNDNGC